MVEREIHIRRAIASDSQVIANLSAITFFDTFKGTCTDADMEEFLRDNFNEERIKTELQDNDDYYFIALVNDVAAGYIRMKEGPADIAIIKNYKAIELKRIYVLKEYLSQKIGVALLNFALDLAAKKYYDIIWLGVWEYNERAKNFYFKYGFIDTGEGHPFPIGNTPQTDIWLYRFVKQ